MPCGPPPCSLPWHLLPTALHTGGPPRCTCCPWGDGVPLLPPALLHSLPCPARLLSAQHVLSGQPPVLRLLPPLWHARALTGPPGGLGVSSSPVAGTGLGTEPLVTTGQPSSQLQACVSLSLRQASVLPVDVCVSLLCLQLLSFCGTVS